MVAPNPQVIVTDISPHLIQELTSLLNENERWREVAHEFNIRYGLFNQRDITRIQKDSNPSWRFLQHVASRCGTVGHLIQILRSMEFYNALALLVEPEPVVIIEQPGEDQEEKFVFKGGELRLSCRVTGIPPPYCIWFHDNEELTNQTTSSLLIKQFSELNEGEYHCSIYQEVDDNVVQILSNTVNVKLHPSPPEIYHHPKSEVTCHTGGSVRLCCIALGHPEPQYEWYKGNSRIPGEEYNVLNILDLKLSNSGHYRCYVKNTAGAVWSNMCYLSVVPQGVFPGLERLTAKEKVALLIGNDVYCNLTALHSPRNDVVTIAQILRKIGFKVIALHNLTLLEMRNALKKFSSLVPEGGYAIFHFGGHGFEMRDKFMLPVDAPGSGSYLCRDSLCEKEVIREILKKKPKLLFMQLDMCLKVPDRNENPHIYGEVPETFVYEPQDNMIIQYSTTSNLNAYERKSVQNSNYVNLLKTYLGQDIPLQKILDFVKRASNAAGKTQIPFYSSNVAVDIYLTDKMEENEETKKLYESLTTLPQIENVIKFDKTNIEAGIKLLPHRNVFLNSLDIIISGLQKYLLGIELSCKPEEGTVDRTGECHSNKPELMK
ncbi:hypothetical protein L9F63_014926, partial [Diploptera punctata]